MAAVWVPEAHGSRLFSVLGAARLRSKDDRHGLYRRRREPHPRPPMPKLHGPEGFAGMRKAGQLAMNASTCCAREARRDHQRTRPPSPTISACVTHSAAGDVVLSRLFQVAHRTSINHVVRHGTPATSRLKDGDIVNIDGAAGRRLARRLRAIWWATYRLQSPPPGRCDL